jgi:exoribonuclease-2
VDEDKNITIKRLETNLQSHKIVKEMMVLANNIAANFCINNDIPCIFISQPEPDSPLPFDKRENLNRREVTEVLKRMKRSEMGTLPLKHSGLGISAYTQASSPIRRYNDLLVHRQIKSFIKAKMEDEKSNTDTIISKIAYNQEDIQMVAATSEQTARETMSIERESRRYWLLKYLKDLVGEVTQAYVIRKINVNYKVMLDNTLTSAILVTSEEIEEGVMVDVKIESVRIRSDNITVKLA